VAATRGEHLAMLRAKAGSTLEVAWLERLDALGLELPSDGQTLIADHGIRPDFVYHGHGALVFIDGPKHDVSDLKTGDAASRGRLEEAGYLVIVFRYDDQDAWDAQFAAYPSIFGAGS
jgi:hypothetical protein